GILCVGTVIQEYKTSNVAREAALMPDFLKVTLACISSNVAITNVMNMLSTGYCNAGIAGGVELLTYQMILMCLLHTRAYYSNLDALQMIMTMLDQRPKSLPMHDISPADVEMT
ncbi:hypothetical protein WUBG_11846, partial [Wuchereria bancrofti]